jgi:hypothetical protein
MALGSSPYLLTVGTHGGYVMAYDVRYNLTSVVYKHTMNYPVLAMATLKPRGSTEEYALVSSGGPIFEMS